MYSESQPILSVIFKIRFSAFLFGLILWSCGNEKGNGKVGSFDFSIEIDTVLVDSKGEVLMAGTYLSAFDLSQDKKYLYNFDANSHQIEVIDLDKLSLVRKIQMEKDGPNGVEYPNSLFEHGDGQFLFSNFNSWTVVNQDAHIISKFTIKREKFLGDSLLEKEELNLITFS
jgi:hypothetical protein